MLTHPSAWLRAATLVFLWIALLYGSPLLAETGDSPTGPDAQARILDRIEQSLNRGDAGKDELSDQLKEINKTKNSAYSCVAEAGSGLKKIDQDLASLGERAKGEPTEVRRKRAALSREQSALNKGQASCQLLVLRSEELFDRVTATQTELLTRRLLERGPNFVALLHENWEQPAIWVTASRTFLLKNTGVDQLTSTEWVLLVLALSTALLLGALFRRRLNGWGLQHHWQDNFASRFSHSLTMTFTHYAPYLLTSAAAAVFCYYTTKGTQPTPFISVVAYGLPVSFLLVSIIRVFLTPCAPAKLFLDIPKTVARVLARRLILLVLLTFLGYLLFSTLLAQSLPDPALLLTRGVYAAVFILNLIWTLGCCAATSSNIAFTFSVSLP